MRTEPLAPQFRVLGNFCQFSRRKIALTPKVRSPLTRRDLGYLQCTSTPVSSWVNLVGSCMQSGGRVRPNHCLSLIMYQTAHTSLISFVTAADTAVALHPRPRLRRLPIQRLPLGHPMQHQSLRDRPPRSRVRQRALP